jgi:hypothetical protein
MVLDGPATATVSCPVAGAAPVTMMVSGLGVQVTPGGSPVLPHITCKAVLVKPPAGVTVIVEAALAPAVTVTGVPVTVKLPTVPVVTLTTAAAEGLEAA